MTKQDKHSSDTVKAEFNKANTITAMMELNLAVIKMPRSSGFVLTLTQHLHLHIFLSKTAVHSDFTLLFYSLVYSEFLSSYKLPALYFYIFINCITRRHYNTHLHILHRLLFSVGAEVICASHTLCCIDSIHSWTVINNQSSTFPSQMADCISRP